MSNDMHFWSIHWVFSMIFCKLTLRRFFTPTNGGPKPRKGLEIWLLQTSHTSPFRPRKVSHSRFLGDAGGPMLAAHPVLRLRRNLRHLSFWNSWKFLPSSVRQKMLPMHSSGETYGKNASEHSSNVRRPEIFQIVF